MTPHVAFSGAIARSHSCNSAGSRYRGEGRAADGPNMGGLEHLSDGAPSICFSDLSRISHSLGRHDGPPCVEMSLDVARTSACATPSSKQSVNSLVAYALVRTTSRLISTPG